MNTHCITLCLFLSLKLLAQPQIQFQPTASYTNVQDTPSLKQSKDKDRKIAEQDSKIGTALQEITIAFYNLENLFHPSDDPQKFDEDRTPDGADQWTYEKYQAKLANMARAISEIGHSTPSIIGLCELENRQVLQDLLSQPSLSSVDYGIIHYESPDLRGVDVGLIYRKSHFNPNKSLSIKVPLYDEKKDKPIWTRDQLLVQGELFGKPIYIIVNHWPSRSGGKQHSESKRMSAAKVTKRVTDSLLRLNPQSQIILMGDFNDNPSDPSIQKIIQSSAHHDKENVTDFFNPMKKMYDDGIGSLAFRDQWFLFDQIILTHNFSDSTSKCKLRSAGVHKTNYLVTAQGRFRGYPFRSMQGSNFTGGYSDHFPVYITLSL